MKLQLGRIAVVAAIVITEFASQAKELPEFMNAQQLAVWREHHTPPTANIQNADNKAFFFTGKPYEATSENYIFKYRTYRPNLARWTTTDPNGFPDGANNLFYAPVPTRSLDTLGLFSMEIFGDPDQGCFLAQNGSTILGGGVYLEWEKTPTVARARARLVIKPTLDGIYATKDIYRWRQHFTITDQDKHIVHWNQWKSCPLADNLLDTIGQDNPVSDWYLPNNGLMPSGNNAWVFIDNPQFIWSFREDLFGEKLTKVTISYTLELVQVVNMNQNHGGIPVATIH